MRIEGRLRIYWGLLEATGVHGDMGRITHIAVEIGVATPKTEGVFCDKALEVGRIIAGAVVDEAGSVVLAAREG